MPEPVPIDEIPRTRILDGLINQIPPRRLTVTLPQLVHRLRRARQPQRRTRPALQQPPIGNQSKFGRFTPDG